MYLVSPISHCTLPIQIPTPTKTPSSDEDDEGLKTWIWRPNASAEPDDSNEAEAGAVESSACYFDLGLIVNFRVEKENWNDQAPAPPKVRKPGEPEPEQVVEHKVSYSIEASMGEPGLGGVTWW